MTGTTDGRLRKGERRRRALIDATVRVIGRAGVAGVSQRVVAAEADVPASAVTYYFPTVDDLLLTVLSDVNAAYLARLDDAARADDPLDALTDVVVAAGRGDGGARAAAELELFALAGRGGPWQAEYERWTAGLERFLGRYDLDGEHLALASVTVDGLFLRAYCLPHLVRPATVRAVLRTLTGA
ncbi:TetR family transcriptional regulator [Actinomycetospora sp. TBRC 11914]|uniref:TetR/AcrR family transcriptional regulator n=1 Tax=Actinomycetospora sp. TBRC 11914 TaxID=2729387 RepID=UPI00145E700B|nr:TetR family transcriptional regulator [Actinomycetospora sp. TBRC 11914]NMO88414.1 TetR family transcriptional regulator [Actinomycetospora sp. TBRC 11914]